jgi:hypothetical protein
LYETATKLIHIQDKLSTQGVASSAEPMNNPFSQRFEKKLHGKSVLCGYFLSNGDVRLLEPGFPPSSSPTYPRVGDVYYHKYGSLAQGQFWISEKDGSSMKWKSVEDGYERDMGGEKYRLTLTKDLPTWMKKRSYESRESRARSAKRRLISNTD